MPKEKGQEKHPFIGIATCKPLMKGGSSKSCTIIGPEKQLSVVLYIVAYFFFFVNVFDPVLLSEGAEQLQLGF